MLAVTEVFMECRQHLTRELKFSEYQQIYFTGEACEVCGHRVGALISCLVFLKAIALHLFPSWV
jgi:hypothetical protein